MFMYFLLPHSVPATWRSLAQTSMRAELPSGKQPTITIHEIREGLQLPVSDETVRRAVVKMGYVYKKKSLHASEQERPRCQEQAGGVEKPYVGERRG